MNSAVTILHLSDLQFGSNHRFGQLDGAAPFDTLFERLSLDLIEVEKENVQPEIVVVSGDLAEQGLRAEFEDALQFLNKLSQRTGIPKHRFVVVPGNHDINRKLSAGYFATCEGDGEAPLKPYWPKWKHYHGLFERFYAAERGIQFTREQPWTLYEVGESKVVVAALNSTIVESHFEDSHYGFVGEEQLRWFADRLTSFRQRGWLRIAVVHHNLTRGATDDDENLRDADDLKRILRSSVNLILHGHIHKDGLDWADNKTPILSTGSAALKAEVRPAEIANQYQLVRISAHGFQRWGRCYDAERKRWIGDTRISESGDDWHASASVKFEDVSGTFSPSAGPASADHIAAAVEQPRDAGAAAATTHYDPQRRYVSIPFAQKGDQVIGREADLLALRAQLESGFPTAIGQTAAFHGLGGLGKTQLAVEYAYKYEPSYGGGVFWITADQDIDAQLTKLAVDAWWIAPESESGDKLDVAQHQLRTRRNTLVVFDNVEDKAAIEAYLPDAGTKAHILVTSRLPVIGFAEVHIELLDSLAATQMLVSEAGQRAAVGEDLHVIAEIIEDLGRLPLAIELAGAFVRNREISWRDYLARLRTQPREVLPGRFLSSWTRHEADLYITLQVSAEVIAEEPLLRPILDVLTWSGPATIGTPLLAALLGVSDLTALSPALGLGSKLKILQQSPGTKRYAVHRLVREVRRAEIPFEMLDPTPEVIVSRLGAWFLLHREKFADLSLYEAEIDHLKAWQEHAEKLTMLEAARLAWLEAYPPYHRGKPREVRAAIDKAFGLFNRSKKQDAALHAHLLNDRGWTEFELGNATQSKADYQAAYQIRLRALGEANPDTAASMTNIAQLLKDAANFDEALELAERSLAVRRSLDPPQPAAVATALIAISSIQNGRGKHTEALAAAQEALELFQREHTDDDPETAHSLVSVALTFNLLGRHRDALDLQKRAYDIRLRCLGPNHPVVAESLGLLSTCHRMLHEHDKAIALAQEAIAKWETLVPAHHRRLATAKGKLAQAYNAAGDAQTALPLFELSLSARIDELGNDHPEVAYLLGALSDCYSNLGNRPEAARFAKQSYSAYSRKLGDQHPLTSNAMISVGMAVADLGNLKGGIQYLRKAWDLRRASLGPAHPATVDAGALLANLYTRDHDYFKAKRVLDQLIPLASDDSKRNELVAFRAQFR
jgi:3',5'-cyclic AMP phosphodiesterase CpdA